MLELLLPISSIILMLLFNKNWWLTTSSMIMIIPLAIIKTMTDTSFISISTFSGMDTMSFTLLLLSIWISAMMMIASTSILYYSNMNKLFQVCSIILLITLINCFTSSNMILFYVWFEASLIPTMFLIMLWGYQPERMQASMYLMMYTVTASLPMFISFWMVASSSNHMLMTMNMEFIVPAELKFSSICSIILIGGFLVKLPMFSVHLWLPKAHVEAPIAGSMVLAAILLKLGGYGIARLMSLIPNMSPMSAPMLISLSLTGAVITSLICMRQPDLKSLIAYSSVGHMGLMLSGMLTNTQWGMSGALMMMIAHGLGSSALFILANLNYEITHTRSMYLTKGLLAIAPTMTMFWFIFASTNMAAPPSINLMSEIVLITSLLSFSNYTALPIAMLSFFTACYSLIMFSTVQHGQPSSFINPLQPMKSKDKVLLIAHLYPIIFIVLKPDIISTWM